MQLVHHAEREHGIFEVPPHPPNTRQGRWSGGEGRCIKDGQCCEQNDAARFRCVPSRKLIRCLVPAHKIASSILAPTTKPLDAQPHIRARRGPRRGPVSPTHKQARGAIYTSGGDRIAEAHALLLSFFSNYANYSGYYVGKKYYRVVQLR